MNDECAHKDSDAILSETSASEFKKATSSSDQAFEVPGYDLRECIGRGGMGDVYRAFDREMNRDVAVKILQDRYAVDSHAAARFVEEARITGQLQHPGIPAVYRVAHLADGRPFLAMKLIKGQTLETLLTTNAALNHLSVIEVVAQALGYAHSHEVIHRDIKPHNIMIGSFGEVQLMDWGLAKVIDRNHLDTSLTKGPEETVAASVVRSSRESDFTQAGSIVGTPAYLPPEQAAGEHNRIGFASDVFGVGALWCRLLTGQPPFVGPDADSVRRKAVRGQVEEALSRLDQCGAEPEVVALCKRCLEVEPEDRPQNGSELAKLIAQLRIAAEDRAKEAELARVRAEVEIAEQLKQKSILRRAAIAVATVLLIGVLGTSIGLYYANAGQKAAREAERIADEKRVAAEKAERQEAEQRKAAQAAEALAKSETELATAVKAFLQFDVLQLASPHRQKSEASPELYDADLRLRDVVIRASERIEGKFPGRPAVVAEIRQTLGETLYRMGRLDLAVGHLEKALEWRRKTLGEENELTLQSVGSLASCYSDLGRNTEALAIREELLGRCKMKYGPSHINTLSAMTHLGYSLQALQRKEEALQIQQDGLELAIQTLGSSHEITLNIMSAVGISLFNLGRHQEALAIREEGLAKCRQFLGKDAPGTLLASDHFAQSLAQVGRYEDAIRELEETVPQMRAKLGPAHFWTVVTTQDLSQTYYDSGHYREARSVGRDALAGWKAAGRVQEGASFLELLIGMYTASGHKHETEALRKEWLEFLESRNAAPIASLQETASSSNILKTQGSLEEEIRQYEEALAKLRVEIGNNDPNTIAVMINLGVRYGTAHRHSEAVQLFQEATTLREMKLGKEHLETVAVAFNLASSYFSLGQFEEAEKLFKDNYRVRSKGLGVNHPLTVYTDWGLIGTLMSLKKYDEASARIDSILDRAQEALGTEREVAFTPDLIAAISEMRVKSCRELKDVEGCRGTAERFEKRNPTTAGDLYNAARIRAVTAVIQSQANIENANIRANQEADKGMTWLVKAVTAGFNDREQILKDENLAFLRAREDFQKLVADLLIMQESPEGKIRQHEEALAKLRAEKGNNNPDTIRAMINLGVEYDFAGQHPNAALLYEEALKLLHVRFGKDHLETVEAAYNLARCYLSLDKFEEAEKLFKDTYRVQSKELGADHPLTLDTEWGLIATLMELKKYDEASALIVSILDRAQKTLGTDREVAFTPDLIAAILGMRIEACRETKDVEGCRDTAERYEKRNPTTADDLYNAACARAVTATLQSEVNVENAKMFADQDADKAMAWLTQAVAAGFNDREHILNDPDLVFLRSREDFQKLAASLPDKPMP